MKVCRVLEYEVQKKNWLVLYSTNLNLIRLTRTVSQTFNLITCSFISSQYATLLPHNSQWDRLATRWLAAHNFLTRTLVILYIYKQ